MAEAGTTYAESAPLAPLEDSQANLQVSEVEQMKLSRLIGHQLKDLVDTDIRHSGYWIYLLADREDTVGMRVADDYKIRTILERHPDLATATVRSAEDYYGQIILRVIW